MSLLLADLRALANLPTTAVGRRISIGMVIGLALLALMAWWLASWVLPRVDVPQADQVRAQEPAVLALLAEGLLDRALLDEAVLLEDLPDEFASGHPRFRRAERSSRFWAASTATSGVISPRRARSSR